MKKSKLSKGAVLLLLIIGFGLSVKDSPIRNFEPPTIDNGKLTIAGETQTSLLSENQREQTEAGSKLTAADFLPKAQESLMPVAVNTEVAATDLQNIGDQSKIDPKYPAADFQPKVIYINEAAASADIKALLAGKPENTEPEGEIDPKFPAANFQPKELYFNEYALDSSAKAELDKKPE